MDLLIEDFVNREAQLAALWKMIRQELDQRLLLVHGPKGIGKTYLLDELQAECQAEDVACVRIGFDEPPDKNYMAIVLGVRQQLGAEGFGELTRAITETSTYGVLEASPRAAPRLGLERPEAEAALVGARSGGVDFYEQATIYGDVVGRDVIHITQLIQNDDPMVQQVIQTDITAALRYCLVELTKRRPIVFLFDAWERATSDTRDWLSQSLLRWILEKRLARGVAVVAGSQVPDFDRLTLRSRRITLDRLPDEAVHNYWIEKCSLPPEDVTHIVKYSRGNPMVMALMADERAMALTLSD